MGTTLLSCFLKLTQQPLRKKMKKIYRFDCLNNSTAITVDEFQHDPDTVILKVHNGDEILLLSFTKDEFHELCNMRYRLDFPELPAQSPELSLVA